MGGVAKQVVAAAISPMSQAPNIAKAVGVKRGTFLDKAAGAARKTSFLAAGTNTAILSDAVEGKDVISKRGGLVDTVSGNRAKREANDAAGKAADAQRGFQNESLARQSAAEDEAAKIKARNASRSRSRALSLGYQGRASTILTSGASNPNTATKTLLGQ